MHKEHTILCLERLQITLASLELVEDLKMTRMVSSEEEKRVWDHKYEYKGQLDDRLRDLTHIHQVEVKALLEKYDMRYIENQNGTIEYSYQGERRY